jgi:hypothetical protein
MGFRNIMQPKGSVVAVANQDAFIQLVNSVQTIRLLVSLTAVMTITAPVTTIQGTGSLSQAVRIGLVDAGTDRVRVEGKSLLFIANCWAPSAVTETAITTTGNQVTTMLCRFPVWFASPFSANPMEAAFLERDPNTVLQFAVFQKSTTPASFIVAGGTAVLGAITASVTQEAQFNRTTLPYYIPTMREVTMPVTNANANMDFILNTKLNKLRGILLAQDTNVGTVNDIIQPTSSLALLGDNAQLIGPQLIPIDQLAELQEFEFGGSVYPVTNASWLCSQRGAQIFFHFQKWGRLANLLNPQEYTNLRFNVNVNVSAQVGATTSLLRATLLEMERPPKAGDRAVVAPLPAALV